MQSQQHCPCQVQVLWQEGSRDAFFPMWRRMGSITCRCRHGERIGLVQQDCHVICVMWSSCDLFSRCVVMMLPMAVTKEAERSWNMKWGSTSILRLFSLFWIIPTLLTALDGPWRLNWILKDPARAKFPSQSKCMKWRVSDSVLQCYSCTMLTSQSTVEFCWAPMEWGVPCSACL